MGTALPYPPEDGNDANEDVPPEISPANATTLTLRYVGRDVDDGSIAVDDLLSALNGFSSAFYKLAERESLDYKQRIKVTGISRSSANVHLEILQWAAGHPLLTAAGTAATPVAVTIAKKITEVVIDRIVNVAKAKKHVQRGSFNTEISGDGNTVVIVNGVNARLPVSREDFEIMNQGAIDTELDKMSAPLRQDFIDAFEIKRDEAEAPDLRIDASDRPYFVKLRREATTTQEVTLTGTLLTISKVSNSGTFVIENGRKVRYKFSDPEHLPNLYAQFAHLGFVRVRCKAKLDENLDVISIEISDIQPL